MNLQKLLNQRSGTKKTIERFIEKITNAGETEDGTEFETTLRKIQEKVDNIKSLNEKILTQTDVDAIEEEIIETEDYMLDLDITIERLRQQRPTLQRSTEDTVSDLQSQAANNREQTPQFQSSLPSVSRSNSNTSQFNRLPKLTLPIFDGDILQWQSFWDSFDAAIHSNESLNDVQKFGYLKAQLEGTAAMTVEGFALTNANYNRAVELLRERYGQQNKIIHATMQALLKLEAPVPTINSLRFFYDRMETYIRGLESLGQTQDMYGSLLVPIIIDKLPSDIRKNLARVNENNDWKLQNLREAINKEISILQTGSGDLQRLQTDDHAHRPTALFYTGTKGKDSYKSISKGQHQHKTIVECAFCKKDHHSSECTTFSDVNKRLSVIKQKKLCFNCLGKHQLARCKSKRNCRFCNKRHHSSICSTNGQVHINTQQQSEAAILYANSSESRPDVLLKTAVAEVESDKYAMFANILFDEGAQRTFISEKLADKLRLPRTGTDTIRVASFGNHDNHVRHMDKGTINLRTDCGEKIKMDVLIVPTIAVPLQNRIQSDITNLPYLQGLKLAHPLSAEETFEISLLVGADYYWQVVKDRVVRGNGPTAVDSKIGYLLSGPVKRTHYTSRENHIMNVVIPPSTAENIDRFWKLESLGISKDEENEETHTDALLNYQKSHIFFKDGKYEAKLPWKEDHDVLPTNYYITKRRTESTIRQISKDPKILKTYSDIIADQEKKGFIEKVPDDELQRADTKTVHYIPHHPVKKDSDTTPVRIVYDCSCHQTEDSPSLNDCLDSTPPVPSDLSALLVKFRLHKFAVSTDIEKAFLHVGLHANDRDATRFLWLSDPSDVQSPLQTYRFKSVLFGATCSPFILSATLLKHLQDNDSWISRTMARDLYVDNIISSFPREDTLLKRP